MSNDDPYVGLEPREYAALDPDDKAASIAEVMQNEEADLPAVPIRQVGPLKVIKMGNKEWVSGNVSLDAAISMVPVRILNNNPNRARAVVWAGTAGPTIGRSQAEAVSAGAVLPLNVPITMEHSQEVWVRVPTGTSVVSWLEEVWTE